MLLSFILEPEKHCHCSSTCLPLSLQEVHYLCQIPVELGILPGLLSFCLVSQLLVYLGFCLNWISLGAVNCLISVRWLESVKWWKCLGFDHWDWFQFFFQSVYILFVHKTNVFLKFSFMFNRQSWVLLFIHFFICTFWTWCILILGTQSWLVLIIRGDLYLWKAELSLGWVALLQKENELHSIPQASVFYYPFWG